MPIELKKNWPILLCALLAGLIMVVPQLVFLYQDGLYPLASDAEAHYLARMREAVDGFSWGNPYLAGLKSTSLSPFFVFGEYLLGLPAKFLPISVLGLNLIYKFLFPVLLFLLIYKLARQFLPKLWALAGAFGVVLGYNVFTIPGLVHLFKWQYLYSQFAIYARPINPQFSSLFFFAYLYLAWQYFKNPSRKTEIGMGLILGASFYIYFYLWTFLLILTVALCLVSFFKPKYRFFGFVTLGIGVLVGIPQMIHMLNISRHPYFANLKNLIGFEPDRHVHLSTLGLAVTVFWAFTVWRKGFKIPQDLFLAALLLAGHASTNQQILTGYSVQFGHYHWYYNAPVFILTGLIASHSWVNSRKYLAKVIPIIIIVLAVTNSVFIQTSSYKKWRDQNKFDRVYIPALRWLDSRTHPGDIVLANDYISNLIPVYTGADVYWNEYAKYYLLPKNRSNDYDYVIWDTRVDARPVLYKSLTIYSQNGVTIFNVK